MLLLNVEVHLLRILVKLECKPHPLNIYGGNIDVSSVLRSKGTHVCNSSSSVFNRTSPSLLRTFVVDTLLNFPMPFNIILTYINTTRIEALRCLLVEYIERVEIITYKV